MTSLADRSPLRRALSGGLLTLGLSLAALAAAAAPDAIDRRIEALAQELRCVVCQNQSLAESASGVARDMRRDMRQQMQSGASDEDVVRRLTARYGDFVRYRPRWSLGNALLWLGPTMALAVAMLLWLRPWWQDRPGKHRPEEAS